MMELGWVLAGHFLMPVHVKVLAGRVPSPRKAPDQKRHPLFCQSNGDKNQPRYYSSVALDKFIRLNRSYNKDFEGLWKGFAGWETTTRRGQQICVCGL